MDKISYRTLIFLLLCISSCSDNDITSAFKALYLSKYAVEFPQNNAQYRNCINKPLPNCQLLIEKVQEGRNQLESLGSERAIRTAFRYINQYCPSGENRDEELCKGAIISFYFYNDDADDSLIRTLFSELSPIIQSEIFSQSSYEWFHNRQSTTPWIEIIENIPDEHMSRIYKDSTIRSIQSGVNNELRGIALID